MPNVLVTGGAGYIGSHTCKILAQRGYTPVVLDNLVHGQRANVRWGPFFHGDVADAELVGRVLDHDLGEVRLPGHRAETREFRAVEADDVVPLRARIGEGDELFRGFGRHGAGLPRPEMTIQLGGIK